MNTILKKQDKTYGGYDYIEFNTERKCYHTGNTRAHTGHYGGNSIAVEVTTKKELNQIEKELRKMGYEYVNAESTDKLPAYVAKLDKLFHEALAELDAYRTKYDNGEMSYSEYHEAYKFTLGRVRGIQTAINLYYE